MTATTVRIIDNPPHYAALTAEKLTDAQASFVSSRQPITLAVGGPGTGKTAAVIAKAHVELAAGSRVIVLGRGRLAADALHAELRARLGEQTPMRTAYTASSLAYALLAASAEEGITGEVRPAPRMVTGADADAVLAELIGHVIDAGPESADNAVIFQALTQAGLPAEAIEVDRFRHELRDAIMRAQEYDRGPEDIAELAERYEVPAWRIVAEFFTRYEQIQALAAGAEDQSERLDVSALVAAAAGDVARWPAGSEHLPDLVIVDDAHELTHAGFSLIDALASRGVRIALVANPDQSVETFRGAQPEAIARYAPAIAFETSFIHPKPRLDILSDLASRLPTAGLTAQRHLQPTTADGSAPLAHILPTLAQEEHHVANLVRAFNLTGNVDKLGGYDAPIEAAARIAFRDIAVITRSSADVGRFSRALRHAGIPVRRSSPEVLLTDEPAVRPLIAATRIAIDYDRIVSDVIRPGLRGGASDVRMLESEEYLDEVDALYARTRDLLASPLIGTDPVDIRRLTRFVGTEGDPAERPLAGGAQLRTKLRFIEACLMPVAAEVLPEDIRRGPARAAAMITAAVPAAREGQPAQSVLWKAWHAAGLAETWREQALSGESEAATADHNLDALMALFDMASTHAERNVGASATVFLDDLERQDIASDTLADHGQVYDGVAVMTVGQAAGRHWPVVIVPGVYDGAWPDTRIRDTTVRWQALVDVFAGRSEPGANLGQETSETYAAARRETVAGEMRMFLAACACATEHLIVTSVDDGETLPSILVPIIDPQPTYSYARRQLSARGAVAALRAALENPATPATDLPALAARLAELAELGVPGADPASWPGLWQPTSDADILPETSEGYLGPSGLESLLTCPLKHFLETSRATDEPGLHLHVGTLIHALAEEFAMSELPLGELTAAMHTRLDELFSELPLPRRSGWLVRALKQTVVYMTDNLARYLDEHRGEALTEFPFRITEHGLRISGRIDRIELSETGDRIVDFKTSRSPVVKNAAAVNPQLALYQHGYQQTGRDVAMAVLVYPRAISRGKPAERFQPPLKDTAIDIDALLTAARGFIARGEKKAFVNEGCSRCPVKRSCPAQVEGTRVV